MVVGVLRHDEADRHLIEKGGAGRSAQPLHIGAGVEDELVASRREGALGENGRIGPAILVGGEVVQQRAPFTLDPIKLDLDP